MSSMEIEVQESSPVEGLVEISPENGLGLVGVRFQSPAILSSRTRLAIHDFAVFIRECETITAEPLLPLTDVPMPDEAGAFSVEVVPPHLRQLEQMGALFRRLCMSELLVGQKRLEDEVEIFHNVTACLLLSLRRPTPHVLPLLFLIDAFRVCSTHRRLRPMPVPLTVKDLESLAELTPQSGQAVAILIDRILANSTTVLRLSLYVDAMGLPMCEDMDHRRRLHSLLRGVDTGRAVRVVSNREGGGLALVAYPGTQELFRLSELPPSVRPQCAEILKQLLETVIPPPRPDAPDSALATVEEDLSHLNDVKRMVRNGRPRYKGPNTKRK